MELGTARSLGVQYEAGYVTDRYEDLKDSGVWYGKVAAANALVE